MRLVCGNMHSTLYKHLSKLVYMQSAANRSGCSGTSSVVAYAVESSSQARKPCRNAENSVPVNCLKLRGNVTSLASDYRNIQEEGVLTTPLVSIVAQSRAHIDGKPHQDISAIPAVQWCSIAGK